MYISAIAFSPRGLDLAQRIAKGLSDSGEDVEVSRGFGEGHVGHATWAADEFDRADALVFVGAMGIAIRSIAPCLENKTTDPAVVVIDERALHCISVLSGHIGGANQLTRRIAAIVGADPVITTATDINGVFAVDSWAVDQGMSVVDPARIKLISSALLAGDGTTFASEFPLVGSCPEGIRLLSSDDHESAEVSIGIHASVSGLRLAPRALVLGVGCRRNTTESALSEAFSALCEEHDLLPQAFGVASSIDLKADEKGLIEFCDKHGLKFEYYSAEELDVVPGDFHSSEFVRRTTGTDNVCERATMCAGATRLIVEREVKDGVTMAVGICPVELSWPDVVEGVDGETTVMDGEVR